MLAGVVFRDTRNPEKFYFPGFPSSPLRGRPGVFFGVLPFPGSRDPHWQV